MLSFFKVLVGDLLVEFCFFFESFNIHCSYPMVLKKSQRVTELNNFRFIAVSYHFVTSLNLFEAK